MQYRDELLITSIGAAICSILGKAYILYYKTSSHYAWDDLEYGFWLLNNICNITLIASVLVIIVIIVILPAIKYYRKRKTDQA